MVTSLTLYGSTSLASTVATASKLVNATGGTSTSKTTTAPNDSSQNFMEWLSQGGTGTDSASIGSPSGKGYLYDVTTLEGNTIALGNWSGVWRMNDTAGFTAVTMIMRAYVYNSGLYTAIGTMTLASQSMSSTTTNYTFSNTSFPAVTFYLNDKLYIDGWMHPITGHWTGDPIVSFMSSSASAGIANQMQVNTPGFSLTPRLITRQHRIFGRVA